ncbi:MAG: agmatine deiminase family protein, partial [Rhodoferax sp.]
MPGEFEAHRRCWLVWPERTDYFRQGAKPAQRTLVQIANAISQGEPVAVCVSARQFGNAVRMLPPHVQVIELSTDDMWIRDCGPCFVRNAVGQTRVVDFAFNGWAGLTSGQPVSFQLDSAIPHKIAQLEGMDRYVCDLVAEGGNLCSDGQGTLIVTAENLMDPARNRTGLSRLEIESLLCSYLGARKVIWLERGLKYDV